jgi:hypothetical protein
LIVPTAKWPDTITLVIKLINILRVNRGRIQITGCVKGHAHIVTTLSSVEGVKQRTVRAKVLDSPVSDTSEDRPGLESDTACLCGLQVRFTRENYRGNEHTE